MMIVDRNKSAVTDGRFTDLPGHLGSDDVLILNNTKVFPARLIGKTETGSTVEVFLVTDLGDDKWEVLAKPARRLSPGKLIRFGDLLSATAIERMPNGMVSLSFTAIGDFFEILDEIGRTPLPPYIKREDAPLESDRERYQTVYARKRGAIAAPTAGLHFTPDILESIRQKGVTVVEITLHVGYGTFEPIRAENLADHRVLPEQYEISDGAAETLNKMRSRGCRFVAVGTTTARALESVFKENGRFVSGKYMAGVTVTPGYEFQAVDALLTNFHLPCSSLLILTSTFGGYELIMSAYRHAVAARYRFYSYGDCMLIV